MQASRCPAHPDAELVAGAVRTRDWFWGYEGEFHYGACPDCGSWVLDPRPEPSAIAGYYGRTYTEAKLARRRRAFARQRPGCAMPLDFARARGCVRRLRRLGARLDVTTRVLDSGCGLGGFLFGVRALCGAGVQGIDPHPDCVRYARDVHGVAVDQGLLLERGYGDDSFDVATCWHSLEHTYDPAAELAELARVVGPEGWLVLEVPTAGLLGRLFRGRWLYLQAPTHFYHLRPAALRILVERAGFDVVDLRRPWLPSELAGSLMIALGVKGFAPRLLWPERPPLGDRLLKLLGSALLLVDLPVTFALSLLGAGGTLQVVARRRR